MARALKSLMRLLAASVAASFLVGIGAATPTRAASDYDEFRVKREAVFEFAEKPTVTRDGDRVTIRFAARGFCDATVAIEDPEGRIVRHLASGVLGPNAPEPFQKGSREQTVVWDGKDDRGRYIDDKESHTVRVSLGLRPQFERTLFWSPYKRHASGVLALAVTEEGVLAYEGRGHDHVLLYSHDGDYLRTIYPFAAAKLPQTQGLTWRTFPQDGVLLPIRTGFVQASLLTSGTSHLIGLPFKFGDGFAAITLAARNDRIALLYDRLNRLALDGSTGGRDLTGPEVAFRVRSQGYGGFGAGQNIVGPQSAAFTPDGTHLYLTGYMWYEMYHRQNNAHHGVYRLAFDGSDTQPTLFMGEMGSGGHGTDNRHFRVPTSVDVDAKGRVYVSDFLNHRIQVYTSDGAFVRSVPTRLPAKVLVSPKDGSIWVFSYPIYGADPLLVKAAGEDFRWERLPSTVTRYGPIEDPRPLSEPQPLPVGVESPGFFLSEPMVSVAVDWHAPTPRLWVAARKYNVGRIDAAWGGIGAMDRRERDPWRTAGVRIFEEKNGQWTVVRAFAEEAQKQVLRVRPPDFSRQRLYVHPRTHKLYLAEDSGFGKSFKEMLEIDPETGQIRPVDLPFDTEDLAFDIDGRAYLRTDTLVVRYDFPTWREVPWDYGEAHRNVFFSSIGGGKSTDVRAGLHTPGRRPVCWNQGGMGVSVTGLLAVACCSRAEREERRWMDRYFENVGKPYAPPIFPGRLRWGEVHIWDARGHGVRLDAIPGIAILNGTHIDRNGDLYVMAAKARVLGGERYWNEMAGTMLKVTPGAVKVVSPSDRAPLALSPQDRPQRHMDLDGFWVEKPSGGPGAHWLYGGVGFGGFNPSHSGGGCACWNSRSDLDYFARSFAPEIDHFSVAVLDSNGNLITRVGRYGNVDDGRPIDLRGGPAAPNALGGDEVGLFYAPYVAADTDRRLFIADPGNGRVLSVKLAYHDSATIPLKDVPDQP